MPKKLLVYGAHFAEDLVDARRFGWNVDGKAFDWPTLRDNVLAEVDRLNGIYEENLGNQHVTIHHSRAVFLDPHTLDVGGERITAKHILIATGARPLTPDLPGVEHGITSNETFHLEALPKRMVIAGGGYIANEFAGIFHELGVHVTLVNRGDTILRGWEPALRDRLLQISITKGIDFKFNCGFEGVEKTDSGVRVLFSDQDPIDTDMLLWAIGRRPNIEGLGLEAAGVAVNDRHAIQVDADSKTNVDHIHAIGDVTDRIQLTPVAIREGHSFADRTFGNKQWHVDYNCIPSAVFANPPLGSVGMTEAHARNALGHGQGVYLRLPPDAQRARRAQRTRACTNWLSMRRRTRSSGRT